MRAGSPGADRGTWRLAGALAVLVVARLALQAVYLPAFEGPDEPQHLARALDFARRPFREAFAGNRVDADVVASVLAHPCPGRDVGCPPYAEMPGGFDVLHPAPPLAPRRTVSAIPNEEAKQPPLYYFMAGLALRAVSGVGEPARALLLLRFLDVLLVAIAIFAPLRRLFRDFPRLAAAGLIALLTPGAAEAFARCSNDAAVLLWSAAVLWALDRRSANGWIVALLAAGPLVKLTAIPVVVFAAAALWLEGRRGLAAAGAAASLAFLPVQALRGWATGGAAELPRGAPALAESASGWLVGLARTGWTMIKMAPWAMGWSALRPPFAIVAAYVALLAAIAVLARVRPDPRRLPAHAAAAVAAAAGTVVFAVALRRYFGAWGGVTGWYVWSWSAWIAVAARDLLEIPRARAIALLAAEAALVAAASAAWIAQAAATYG